MQKRFGIFRAIGLALSMWGRSFVPFTALALLVYAPAVLHAVLAWGGGMDAVDWLSSGSFETALMLISGLSALLVPLLTYRVIQQMNGRRVPMWQSARQGVRGILPAVAIAAATMMLQRLPSGGGIVVAVLNCMYFVAAPAAVAERLGVGEAFTRSSTLTSGRRWGIFGLTFLLGLCILGILVLAMASAEDDISPEAMRWRVGVVLMAMALLQTLGGIVQAVAYVLLREDKDGVSHEELAKVFE